MNLLKNIFGKYRKGVFIVVYKIEKGKIKYFIEKRKLHWEGYEFPKGGVEKGEKLIDAVRRETVEETGLEILEIKKYKFHGKYLYSKELKDRKGVVGQTWKLFSVKVKDGKVKLDSHEHSGYGWLDYKKAFEKLTWNNQKECLKIVDSWNRKRHINYS